MAVYIIENRATVRDAAGKFGISKSTVHKDISERLPHFNRSLYLQVKEVLDENKAQRHIRGGMAQGVSTKGYRLPVSHIAKENCLQAVLFLSLYSKLFFLSMIRKQLNIDQPRHEYAHDRLGCTQQ